jgi:ADP-heptose:LPS heptosyltransferase
MDHAFTLPLLFDSSLTLEEFSSPPVFRPEAEQHAAEIIAMLPAGSRILAVQTESREHKTWSPSLLHGTLQRFLVHHPDFWVLILGLKSCPPNDGWRNLQVVPCDALSLDTSMCLVERANLFLGVDSCMLHFADLCRTPSVGLFGPTRYSEFGCRLAPHYHVNGHGTMAGIEMSDVLNGLELLLANEPLRTKTCTKGTKANSRRSCDEPK